ncbi:MAG: J domain-containing protein [Clostridia bacterium]|nr:J domain-containing protein [Clostridia bacterium]
MRDPYEILGVKPDATEEQIKTAFHKIAMATHPDKNGGDPFKTQKFRDATDAYHFLMDENERAAYDYYNRMQPEYSDDFYEAKTAEKKAESRRTEEEYHRAFQREKECIRELLVNMLIGLVGLAIGGGLTLISYLMADPGEYYRVYYGPMIVGGIAVAKALIGIFSSIGRMVENWSDMRRGL